MNPLELRPRFKFFVKEPPGHLLDCLAKAIVEQDASLTSTAHKNQITLKFRKHLHHVWSPQLSVEVDETDEGSVIRGLFAPNPSIWTFFVFLYSGFSIIGIFALMLGMTQHSLGKNPWGLWAAGASFFLLMGAYVAAQIGKTLGKPQMDQLKKLLIGAIGQYLSSETTSS